MFQRCKAQFAGVEGRAGQHKRSALAFTSPTARNCVTIRCQWDWAEIELLLFLWLRRRHANGCKIRHPKATKSPGLGYRGCPRYGTYVLRTYISYGSAREPWILRYSWPVVFANCFWEAVRGPNNGRDDIGMIIPTHAHGIIGRTTV